MIVTVIDRKAMKEAWGRPGLYTIITRQIEIDDSCPVCHGPRGTPAKERVYEDGHTVWVDRWYNECGHIDKYSVLLGHEERS